jgi:hypothetical protein
MAAKPLRTRLKRASAERCLRSLGATSAMITPDRQTTNRSVRGVLLHRCLRKGNPESPVFTGFDTPPGIAAQNRPDACASTPRAGPRPLPRSGVCRARVAFLQNRAPRSASPLLTPRSQNPGPCVRRHARLSDHPISRRLLESLRPHRGRRPPSSGDPLPRRSIIPQCPQRSRYPHAS